MKLLWHMPTLRRAGCGLSRRAIRLALGLRKFGIETVLAVHAEKTDAPRDELESIPIRRHRPRRRSAAHWSLQAAAKSRSARALARELQEDHEVFVTCQAEMVSAYAARDARRPVVFVCGGLTCLHRGDLDRSLNALRRLPFMLDAGIKHRNESAALAKADCVVFDSRSTLESATRHHHPGRAGWSVIHGAVDAAEFAPPTDREREAARSRYKFEAQDAVIAWTGRLSPEKNVPLLLSSLARCRLPRINLLLAGDGPEREPLESLARSLSLSSRVRFAGMMDDVRPCLHAADVFAFPSTGESCGCSLIEAMACGLPVIVLRPDRERVCTAGEEIIEHGRTGWLVDANEPAAFAEGLDRLAGDEFLRRRLATAGRAAVIGEFDWSSAAAKFAELLLALRQGALPGRPRWLVRFGGGAPPILMR